MTPYHPKPSFTDHHFRKPLNHPYPDFSSTATSPNLLKPIPLTFSMHSALPSTVVPKSMLKISLSQSQAHSLTIISTTSLTNYQPSLEQSSHIPKYLNSPKQSPHINLDSFPILKSSNKASRNPSIRNPPTITNPI